MYNDTQ
jgi:hypothetical protein